MEAYMGMQLLISVGLYREQFELEDYFGSDDIFAIVEYGSFVFESDEGRFIVNPGEGALFRRNTMYHRHILEPANMYLFRYRSDAPLFDRCHVVFKDKSRIESTLALLRRLDSEIFKDNFDYHKHLFLDMVNQYAIENSIPLNSDRKNDEAIQKSIDFIRKHPHGKLVVSELAAKAELSYVQYLRRFCAYTGMSPSDYISALRVQKAKSMLIETDLLIKDIAAMCGFDNEYYFSNFMKKQTGMSPSVFRAMKY